MTTPPMFQHWSERQRVEIPVRVGELETRMSALEQRIQALEARLTTLERANDP